MTTFVCVACRETLPVAKAMAGHYCIVSCRAADGDSGSEHRLSCANKLCHDCYGRMYDKSACPATDHGLLSWEHDRNVVWLGGPRPYTLVSAPAAAMCFATEIVRVELDPTDRSVTVKRLREAVARRQPKYRLRDYHLRYKGRMVRNGERLVDLGVKLEPRWPVLSLRRKRTGRGGLCESF